MAKLLSKLHSRQLIIIFFGLALFFGYSAITSLRSNNLNMIKLRQAVYDTDKSGGDVETALRNLRAYIYSHMNTDLSSGGNTIKPPIQLKFRYERLKEAEKQRVAAENAQTLASANAECEKKFPKGGVGSGRLPCVQDYLASAGAVEKPINDSLYKFDFLSPRFSLDKAGISIILSAVFFLTGSAVFIQNRLLKHRIKRLI